jgi:predicted nucleic acid-binding protein
LILADSSIWIDHMRKAAERFQTLLERSEIFCHPYIIGELACGTSAHRSIFPRNLTILPQPALATDAEVLSLIELHRLMRRGVGYVGMHLLASMMLEPGSLLLTKDHRLAEAAKRLGVCAEPL